MRWFIYPYDYRNQFLLLLFNGRYEIKGVFTRENWKFDYERLESRGIQVFQTLQIEKYIGQCDAVLFYWNETMEVLDLKECMLSNMKVCLSNAKQVYCLMPLEQDSISELSELALLHKTQFHYLHKQEKRLEALEYTPELCACEVPIVYIGELCEGTGGTELAAGVIKELKSRGYHVCGMVDDVCAQFADLYATPGFIRQNMQEEEKVLRFYQQIKRLEKERKPDIFVIQIPGSIQQFSNKLFLNFGIYCYYYSHAFCPDIFFCTMPGNLSEKLMSHINQTMEAFYGYGMDAIWKTGLYMDQYEAFESGILDFSYQVKTGDQPKTYGLDDMFIVEGESEKVYNIFCNRIEDILSQEEIVIL